MNKYLVNVHYDAVIPVEVIAETEEEALEIAVEKANILSLNEAEVVSNNPCVVYTNPLTPIMNDTNNHNPELVGKINKAYHTNRNEFENIVALLMIRDRAECEERNVNNDVHTYLMQIADDTDLECILHFIKARG